jgi:hypothetical protein
LPYRAWYAGALADAGSTADDATWYAKVYVGFADDDSSFSYPCDKLASSDYKDVEADGVDVGYMPGKKAPKVSENVYKEAWIRGDDSGFDRAWTGD